MLSFEKFSLHLISLSGNPDKCDAGAIYLILYNEVVNLVDNFVTYFDHIINYLITLSK